MSENGTQFTATPTGNVYSQVTPQIERLAKSAREADQIPQELYTKYNVKRGLRDLNGKGVLAGLTNVSEVRAKKIVDHNVGMAMFESNNAGTYYARDVEDLVSNQGSRVSIRTKRTISNKQTRIEIASDGILKHFYFKDKSLYDRNSQYGMFMKELVTYTRSGKVPHDDAPDMLSLAENEFRTLGMHKVEVMRSPFRL